MDDELQFTPETLEQLAKKASAFRLDCLFEVSGSGADPEAELLYLQAISCLEQAEKWFALARIKQSQGLARR